MTVEVAYRGRTIRSGAQASCLPALLTIAASLLMAASCVTLPTASSNEPTAPAPSQPARITSSIDGSEMILVPAGEFSMGDDYQHYDQRPVHKRYAGSFYIDKYEVTNAQYKKFVDATGQPSPHSDEDFALEHNWVNGTYPEGKANYPVVLVSWHDAEAYARWAGKRLPTEAEWEKAARGTGERIFPWGNEPDVSRLNTWEQGPGHSLPVGSYPQGASPYGLMDMAGNVWEWVEDWFERYPGNDWPSDKYGPKYKIARGSSWGNVIKYARTANRHWLEPETKSSLIGFRTAAMEPSR